VLAIKKLSNERKNAGANARGGPQIHRLTLMTSSHSVRGNSRFFHNKKTFFSTSNSGFSSTRSLQFYVLLDEDLKAVSVPAKMAKKKQP
jgi:hypothetical protein